MRATAIIAAGGTGRRIGGPIPKAFLTLRGRPLFAHCLEAFRKVRAVREIVLVLPETWIDRVSSKYATLLRRAGVAKIVPGGARRQDSVWNGLRVADPANEIVLVHDAARPFVTPEIIRRTMEAARRSGAAVAAVPARDTIKLADARGRVLATPPRDRVWHAQTPQAFRREILLAAYRKTGRKDATDDAQLVERAGGKVVLVEGSPANVKITTQEDLLLAGERRGVVLDGRSKP